MDKKILRLLIVDDSPDEADLIAASLRRHGFMLKQQRVQDIAGLQAALDKGIWDAVACEQNTPHLSAHMVQEALKRAAVNVPVLIVTRAITDEDLVKVMRAGACDVILKSRPARLAPAIEREIRAHQDREQLQSAQKRLQETEHKSRAMIDGSLEAICYLQDGMHTDANPSYLQLFGYADLEELTGVPVMNLIDKVDQPRFKELLRKPSSEKTAPQEFTALKNDGSRFPVELTLSAVVLNGEPGVQLLVTDVSKRKAVETKLQYLNQHDALTGLFNRHHLLQRIDQAIEQGRSGRTMAAVLYLNFGQLIEINDELGHGAGDRVLIKVARLFRDQLGEQAVLARLGGHEFGALFTGKSESDVAKLGEGVQKALQNASFSESGKTFKCHCETGAIGIDARTENSQKLLSAVYHRVHGDRPVAAARPKPASAPAASAPGAASAPVNKVAEVQPVAAASAPPADPWAARIQHALDHNRFTLSYQPIVNLHGDPSEVFEVLVRMTGDGGHLISAGEFMPSAEKSGMCAMIDRWVLRNAIEALGAMHREGRKARFFLNLAPTAFKDSDLLPSVIRWIRDAGVKPADLVFQIDAPHLKGNTQVVTFIKAADKLGCKIAIDDFGRDLGNIDYLRDLPVAYLKIHGALIRNLAGDAVSQSALRAVRDVASTLNIKTIAKSVEKAENLAALWNFGVDFVQGYYFDGGGSFEIGEEATLAS